nr:MAG TPA: hypothetical protein [Caudoviricetes sp.]
MTFIATHSIKISRSSTDFHIASLTFFSFKFSKSFLSIFIFIIFLLLKF